jgi:hypothetical protein
MDKIKVSRILHGYAIDFFESSFFQTILVLVVISLLMFFKPSTNALAEDCENNSNAFANCGFERGDFRGWDTQDLSNPFFPLQVNIAGISPYAGFFTSDPPQGDFAALTGFDGNGPGTIRVAQDVLLSSDADTLTFEYECAWDLLNFGATENRIFEVNIEPAGGGAPLQTDNILTAVAGTTAIPSSGGDQSASVDISAFAGQAVRISFDWIVPQNFSGPAFCQLDNIFAIGARAQIPTLSEWGMIAAASGFGLIGVFFAIKRRKAHPGV